MAIVWIIENRPIADSMAGQLVGDFAVRAFRSLKSFGELARVRHRGRPHLVVVDLDSVEREVSSVNQWIDCVLQDIPRIYIASDFYGGADQHIYERPSSIMELVAIIDGYLGSVAVARQQTQRHVTFRSFTLDLDGHRLLLAEGEEEQLSPKETQLLRVFMERPGQKVNRHVIQEAVWQGAAVSKRTVDSHISRLRKRVTSLGLEIENYYGGEFVLR